MLYGNFIIIVSTAFVCRKSSTGKVGIPSSKKVFAPIRKSSDESNKEMLTNEVMEICPGLNANEIQIPHDKHHKVSSLVKSHQNTHNSVKYEVI